LARPALSQFGNILGQPIDVEIEIVREPFFVFVMPLVAGIGDGLDGPAKPRAIAWNGAGGCVIVSHDRQLNFSRTCSVTNHCRGTTSSVSVTSSPILQSLVPPQHGQHVGTG
jgi:hypothetical protein